MSVKLFPDKCTWPDCGCKDASAIFIAHCAAGRNTAPFDQRQDVRDAFAEMERERKRTE